MEICVRQIVTDRAKGHYVPNGLIRWLERLIHQDEMNAFLAQYGHLRDHAFLEAFLSEGLHVSLPKVTLPARVAQCRRPLFVSNHPLGGLDGIILLLALHRQGYDCRAIVNDLLLNVTPIRSLFVPVNKIGAQAREYVEQQRALWQSDTPILTFPAGACSRLQHGEIKDLAWRNTFIRNAIRYERDIVPIYFDGRNSSRFYRVARWRKGLHIPFNIEMMLLPDEMFRAKGQSYSVTVLPPILYEDLSTGTADEWAQHIKKLVYETRH